MKLHKWSESETQAMLVSFRKYFAQDSVEQESRLEVGASGCELDRTHAVAKVEFLGAFFDGTQQSLQAPTQVGGFADVRLGVCMLAAQEEDCWAGRNGGENFGVSLWREFDPLSQHSLIVSKSLPRRHGDTDNNFFA
jgi:hypothetical protein